MHNSQEQSPKVVLGFDFGMKYIGIAVGQSMLGVASPLATLRAKDGIPTWNEITQLIEKWRPQALIVGIPLNMDDTEQLLTLCARRFSNRLRTRYQLPLYEVDERLSSWEAKQRTAFSSDKNGKQKNKLHAHSAVVLIEQWWREQNLKF